MYDAEVCMEFDWEIPSYPTLKELTDYILRVFWEAKFDDDETNAFFHYANDDSCCYDERLTSLERWQEETEIDERFIMKVRMHRFCSVRQLFLEHFAQRQRVNLFSRLTDLFSGSWSKRQAKSLAHLYGR